MKKMLMAVLLCSFLIASNVMAQPFIYVDAAPNVYGSSDYESWKEAAFQNAANGTFVNMQSSINPENAGTTDFEIEDEVVYSFGDLGKRLTWIYWIPDVEVSELVGTGNVTVSLTNIWDGVTSDFYYDYYGSTWLEPTKWEDYDADGDGVSDGVIGLGGMAWWGAYDTNTQEELDADLAAWGMSEETWIFSLKITGDNCEKIYSLESYRAPVPEPGTFGLMLIGLFGFAGLRKKFRKV